MNQSATKLSQNTTRDDWYDNAKAYLIISVFIGHICETLIKVMPFENGTPFWLNTLMKVIYIFHMPVFMLISGRFSKSHVDCNDWISTINKLIIPYIVVQTVMNLFYSTVGYANVSDISYFRPAYGLWYLITLAAYQLITPHLLKIFRRKWLLFPVSLLVAFLVTFQEKAFLGEFQRMFSFFPFFIFGYLTADLDFHQCKKILFRIISIAAFIGLVLMVINFYDDVTVAQLSNKRVYAQYFDLLKIGKLKFIITQILRYTMGFLFFFFIMGISPCKKTFFTRLGSHSNYIYILHLFIVVALVGLGKSCGALDFCKNEIYAILLCIAAIPTSFLLVAPPIEKATKWLVAPNFDLKKIVQKIIK